MMLYAYALRYICIFTMFRAFRCVFYMFEPCMLVGLDWAEPIMFFCYCTSHARALFMHTYFFFFFIFQNYLLIGAFMFLSLSLSLSLSLGWSAQWHPSANLFRPKTLFVPGHHLLILLLFTSGSMTRRPIRTSCRTSPNVAFIRNATLSYQTSPILLY